MKKQFKTALLLTTVFATSLAFTSCDKDDNNDMANKPYTISGNASGSQVVPAVSGNGNGTITGTYDPATGSLTYTTKWNNLTGAPTTSGIYAGASGTTGTSVGSPWNLGSNTTATGNYTGSMTLTAEQAAQLTSGGWYYSYGTAAHPGGEVRGQITATR